MPFYSMPILPSHSGVYARSGFPTPESIAQSNSDALMIALGGNVDTKANTNTGFLGTGGFQMPNATDVINLFVQELIKALLQSFPGIGGTLTERPGTTPAQPSADQAIKNALEKPETFFNEKEYLGMNPDVQLAINAGLLQGVDGKSAAFQHFVDSGSKEGRAPNIVDAPLFVGEPYDSKVKATREAASAIIVDKAKSGDPVYFNEAEYLAMNPDVAKAIADKTYPGTALDHYKEHGAAENRAPNKLSEGMFEPAQAVIDARKAAGTTA